VGKSDLRPGFVFGDLDKEHVYMLSRRSHISISGKDPQQSLWYENPITRKQKNCDKKNV